MNARGVLFLLFAVVGVGLIYWLTSSFLNSAQQPQQQVAAQQAPSVQVLVTAKPLPLGTILKAEDMKWRNWPREGLDPTYPVKDKIKMTDYIGKVVRTSMAFGLPILKQNIIGPGEKGFIAAALRPDMRAITIAVNPTSGVSGLAYPGDRVDLLLSHVVRLTDGKSHSVTETVVQNLRLLAVGQRINDQAKQPGKPGKTATLEVTPKIAEKITLMSRLGSMQLSLRSLATNDPEGTGDMPIDAVITRTWAEEISPTIPKRKAVESSKRVRIDRGSNTQEKVFGDDSGDGVTDNSKSGEDNETPE